MEHTNQLLAEVIGAAPDAMVLVGPEGRIALVNAEAERLFGYQAGELAGQRIELLVPPRLRDAHAAQRARYIADPHRRPMGSGLSLFGRRKDGSHFPVEISLSPMHTDQGTLIAAAVRDITSRLAVEEALKAANTELEAFTYSVSHDLRAPIRQVDGFSRLLEEHLGGNADAKSREYLQRIQDASQHMKRLVEDLLNLSRVGRTDVRPRVISLEAMVRDVLLDLQAEQAGRDVEWRIGPLPLVEYDPGLMKVLLTNLLANALKYTRTRRPAVIEVAHETREGRSVIMIRDNGVGFDMQFADKLFGVFQRLHRADEFEGTGVGLATVFRIVRKHGGEIWAEAKPDAGAAFRFTVPSINESPATA
jgi:PAS domain S-box-containing protein